MQLYVVFLTLVSQLFMLSIRNVEAQTDYKMKTLRFIGMAVVAIIMSLNFAACGDDEEEIDVNQLEGTWGLVRSEGWELCSEETEKDEWNESSDPFNPDRDCEKIVIKKLTDNNYSVMGFNYSGSQWNKYGNSQNVTLNGHTLVVENSDGYFDSYANPVIEVLTSDKLVLRYKYDNVQTDPESEPNHRIVETLL